MVEPELAENRLEQAAPLPIVAGRKVEGHRNVLANVDLLYNTRRSRCRGDEGGDVAIGGGAGGGARVGRHGGVAASGREKEMRKLETRIWG